jgi:hypothetical protein
MPNTFPTVPTNLVCQVCCETALTAFCTVLGPLTNFTNDCSPDPIGPGKPIAVPVATGGSTTLVTPIANFETGDSTLESRLLTPVQLSQPFHLTNEQMQQGFRIQQLALINALKLATAVWARVTPLIKNSATITNGMPTGFPVANVVTAAIASFTPATVGDAYGKLLCTPKHLLLDPAAMGKLMFVAGGCCFPMGGSGASGMGFQSINEHSLWGGSDLNTYGFAFCPEAIVIASGVPVTPRECTMIEQSSVTLPGTGLTVQFNMWCSTATRTLWASYDLMFAAVIGVPCAGVLIKSA